MSGTAFTIAAIAFMAAAFVQGAIGLGFALISAPILTVLAPDLLPVGLLWLMIPLNAYFVRREWASLDRSGAAWITLGRFLGTFGGVWILVALSSRHLGILIGWATILTVVATFIAPTFSPGRKSFLVAGVVTGISETATGIGGPPLALIYQHSPAAMLRSTIAFCFLVGEVISLVFLGISGRTSAHPFLIALMLTPAVAVGALLSRLSHKCISGRALRMFVLVFAMVSGLVLVLRG